MTSPTTSAPATQESSAAPVGRQSRRQLLPQLEQFWLRPVDAAPFVVARSAYGLTVAAWAISLVPDFDLIFAGDGLNRDPFFSRWELLSVFRLFAHPLLLGVALAGLIALGLAVALGRGTRWTVPLAALLQISLSDYAGAWAIGAESVLRILGLFFGVFALITPSVHQGILPSRGADKTSTTGSVPRWPILLIRLQLVLIYLTTGLEKVRGNEWQEGSAVYHALEIEHLRRFEAPAFLTSNPGSVRAMTWGTLALELGLPIFLLIPRTRRWAVLVGVVMHIGFDLFLELGFFGPAMVVGLLAFLSVDDARRLLRFWPFGPRRSAS